MKAHKGDRIILAAKRTDQATRDGEVLEVRGTDGGPPYLVKWTDGHAGLLYPGPGSVLRVEAEHAHVVPAETPQTSAEPVTAGAAEPTVPHVKEWHVRVSIFETGDDTSANVVLLTEAPTHLSAHGQSHREVGDTSARVPDLGNARGRVPHLAVTLAMGAQVGRRLGEQDDVGAGVVPGLEDRHAHMPLLDVRHRRLGCSRGHRLGAGLRGFRWHNVRVLGLDAQDRSRSRVQEPGVPVGPLDEVWRAAVRTPDLQHLSVPRGLVGAFRSEDDAISLVCLHRPSPSYDEGRLAGSGSWVVPGD